MNSWKAAYTILIVLISSHDVCILASTVIKENGGDQVLRQAPKEAFDKTGESSFCCNGENCCKNEEACCEYAESKACCNKNTRACCDGYGCTNPCESQFDAIGCRDLHVKLSDISISPKKLYRILRPDENPSKGLVAKKPNAGETVLSHVNCGSRPKYASQYISTSSSLDTAYRYKKKGEAKNLTGLGIAEIDIENLPQNCKIIDLTSEKNRDKYLGNAVCKNYAKASNEVLLQCNEPIPCKVIDPPEPKETFLHSPKEL